MAGITRIQITDTTRGRGAWRFDDSRRCYPAANKIYRAAFDDIGASLEIGEHELKCTKQEFEAGYDYQLGIDVVFKFVSGQTATAQEKFLFTTFNTVTVEYWQDWRTQEPGDWFNMKCQYYFVGYDKNKSGQFDDWIMLDWSRVMLATAQGRIDWGERQNKEDGARASFRYARFDKFPEDTVVVRQKQNTVESIFWPTGDGRPTWPEHIYKQWLVDNTGTPEQKARYKIALDWYKNNRAAQS